MKGTDTDTGFEAVVRYVADNMAFEPDSYNESYLDRRISARMRRTDCDDYEGYLDILADSEDEQEALLDALSINVTSFFRNPPVWERLRDVLAMLTEEHRTVNCWSAPCADGREPYSIAMLARDDPNIRERAVEITATDIDAEALAEAREGVYESTRTTDIGSQLEPLSDPEAHVEITDDGTSFAVKDDVKRMVTFEKHDLISGRPKSGHDLVLCRNLLIYIDKSYKEPIFETLTDALREGGFLTIGKSETLPRSFRDAYDPYDRGKHIYRRK
ncbi:protein-glutamate O-methyltransferase CheR [Natronomonas pharaonis DSM 2160]|uniref:protein-glutamate O-methyltransferase n=1 Tax=Natronomonas pharaonis (strain ATCC 35678 / DSM 2160 / CIP 103997 / JCM 8858 / NBRC 14720 / NCIMB 2260 / Gabara) TaxID=348780 RepID=A0A1U7EVT5_NATPD|nr:protein-glutamate O-methyltransferase CheR [Natronomonas pharaonis]CAI49176.1 protein-glutamate O-methyltransferase CheR [Natronomonas pharaonis DSM 2160]